MIDISTIVVIISIVGIILNANKTKNYRYGF